MKKFWIPTLFGGWSALACAMPTPVIIDTDMAHDDWMAIGYMLNHPDVDVKAITVVGTGEATCLRGIDNAHKLTNLANQGHIPVTCGRDYTDAYGSPFPQAWRDQVNALLGIELPAHTSVQEDRSAPRLIHDILEASSTPVKVLALGPLTNLSDYLSYFPESRRNIDDLVIMGGAVRVEGNVWYTDDRYTNETAEWNLFADASSAQHVIHSDIPTTLVPLDATNAAPLDAHFYKMIEKDHQEHPMATFVYNILERQEDFVHSGRWYFWDPLAAAVLVDESLASFEHLPIHVTTYPESAQGHTQHRPDGVCVRVAVDADGERFREHFIDTLNGRLVAEKN